VIVNTVVDCASIAVTTSVVPDSIHQILTPQDTFMLTPFTFNGGSIAKSDAFPCFSTTLWDVTGTIPETVTPEPFITFDFTSDYALNLGPMAANTIGSAAKN
jgi:hypothetical protein